MRRSHKHKSIKVPIIVGTILVILIICLINILDRTDEIKYCRDADEIVDLISSNASEINYKDYIEITGVNIKIKPYKQNDEQYDEIETQMEIKNISGKPIKVGYAVFLDPNLNRLFGEYEYDYCIAKSGFDGEPLCEVGVNGTFQIHNRGTRIKDIESLNRIEKKNWENYKDILYMQFIIDYKKAYTKENYNSFNHIIEEHLRK